MIKRILIIIIVYILGAFYLPSMAGADEFLDKSMDFKSAVSFALENNNSIRAMRKKLSATERDIGIARSEMLPQLVFREHYMNTNNPVEALGIRLNQSVVTAHDLAVDTLNKPASASNFLTSGTLRQSILDKKALVKIKMAKKEYSAYGYIYLRQQEDLVTKVSLAYLKVFTDKALLKIAEQSYADVKRHYDGAEKRYKKNPVLYSDFLRAKTGLEQREQRIITAQQNLKISKRNLGLLLGLEASIDIANEVPDIKLQEMVYYKNFSVYRNDIKAAEIRVENAKNNIDCAKADWYPTLNAFVSYNFYNSSYPFGAQGQNYITGASFDWVLFDGAKRRYEILKAKDLEAESKEQLEWFKKNVSFKVFETYSNVEEHKKNLEIAIQELKTAEEDLKIVEKSWENSQLPFVSLIDAQKNLDSARESVVLNQYDLKEDLINLLYESGIVYLELFNT